MVNLDYMNIQMVLEREKTVLPEGKSTGEYSVGKLNVFSTGRVRNRQTAKKIESA
jgi:hypothetical protein